MASLDSLETDIKALTSAVAEIKSTLTTQVAVLGVRSHDYPCLPSRELSTRVEALKETQDQARGGTRVGLVLVALFSAIVGAVASFIAWFK